MRTVDELIEKAALEYNLKCKTIRNDYAAGERDCANGVYDKYYRYNRSDDGQAYDAGWWNANQVIKNDKVNFI